MSYKYGPSIVTDGLVFYVDAANDNSYPGTGTTWTDLIGSNDGTLTNGPTYNSGNGGSIVFDGTNDSVSFSGFSTSNFTQFTIEAWVYINGDTTDGTIIGKWISNVTNRSFLIWWDVGNTANIMFIVKNSSDQNTITSSSTANATNNSWNHIIATFDANSGINLYVNNTLSQTVNHASTPFTLVSTSGFEIGDDESNSRWLDGNVAVTKIYSRVLSAAEVTQNYNALKNRFV